MWGPRTCLSVTIGFACGTCGPGGWGKPAPGHCMGLGTLAKNGLGRGRIHRAYERQVEQLGSAYWWKNYDHGACWWTWACSVHIYPCFHAFQPYSIYWSILFCPFLLYIFLHFAPCHASCIDCPKSGPGPHGPRSGLDWTQNVWVQVHSMSGLDLNSRSRSGWWVDWT